MCFAACFKGCHFYSYQREGKHGFFFSKAVWECWSWAGRCCGCGNVVNGGWLRIVSSWGCFLRKVAFLADFWNFQWITEVLRFEGIPSWDPESSPQLGQGQLQLLSQDCVQLGFVHLHRQGFNATQDELLEQNNSVGRALQRPSSPTTWPLQD